MSFWKFGFTPTAVTGIDSLLNALPPPPPAVSSASSTASLESTASHAASDNLALYESTLDQLLAQPDLLSEIKAGSNPRLTDFLARAEIVQRLGGWVLWGLGGEQLEEVPNGGIISDDVEDGKVPDFVVAAGEKKKVGMGGVPRRRDMDEMGVLEGGEPETEQERSWAAFPRLATEILSSDSPNLGDVLFNPVDATSQPHTCPTPRAFLEPFWETLLRSTELQLETRAVLVGYWARVNAILLNGPRGQEALSHILTIPNLLPRLLTLLPACSPIKDILLLLLRISTPPSPLLTSVVPSALRMLDPVNALGKPGHAAAEELLRGIIELCSSTAAPPPPPPPSMTAGAASAPNQMVPEWRDSSLARQLSEERTVRTMVDWMLAGLELPNSAGLEGGEGTPRSTLPPTPPSEKIDDLRTSSLIQSISVLVDLIRKNNSDFVEQQMLAWAKRKAAEEAEREILEAEGAQLVDDDLGRSRAGVEDIKGPALIDLGALLKTVAKRMNGFHQLVKNPRTPHGPTLTSAGAITPLTLERFRICEFYAELLHCSNMNLLNRSPEHARVFDSDGFLVGGWKGLHALTAAINSRAPEHEEEPVSTELDQAPDAPPRPATPPSRTTKPDTASLSSSPVDVATPNSGISTPSLQESMDEESGILTRSEAKEVQSVVDAAGEGDGDDDDEDPFGDPVDGEETSSSVGDLAAATGELGLEEKEEEEEEVPSLNEATPVLKPAPIFIKPKTANPPPPGQLLKREFMEQRIVNTMLEFFFEFPWNNFLHNVVFDILQQIFHGRIERPLDRQLALSVFLDARLIDRILAGQAANDDRDKARTSRLGYMGHMTLIAEEVVKLFEHYPREIYAVVEPYIPQPGWDRYVATTLRETRDRDHSPLGGGIIHMPDHTSSSMSGLSDEDDEFPMHTARIIRAMEGGGQAGGGAPAIEGPFGAAPRRNSTGSEDAGTSDQFSRYLATAISSDRADKFGSSDEDEDEEDAPGWLGGSRFDPGDVDFALNETNRPSAKFSFDDDFGNGAPTFNRDSTDSDDDGDWGPFSTEPGPSSSSPFGNDDFRPTMASTSGGFESSFGDSGFDNFASGPTDGGGGDDFGDFESGDSPSIVIPSMDALEDFDFEEDGRGPAPAASTVSPSAPFGFRPSRPVFARTATAEDGSALFGGLSTSLEDTPTSPRSPSSSFSPPPLSPTTSAKALSPPTSPSLVADLATSLAEPLGPSMHEGSHFTPDGFIEAEVEGKTVKVPADEITLAHRRASLEGAERPTL